MPDLRQMRRRLAAWIEPKPPRPPKRLDEYYLLVKLADGQPFTLPFDPSATLATYLDQVHVTGWPSEAARAALREHVRSGELLRFATHDALKAEVLRRQKILAYGHGAQ